ELAKECKLSLEKGAIAKEQELIATKAPCDPRLNQRRQKKDLENKKKKEKSKQLENDIAKLKQQLRHLNEEK
ncbi:19259_t:CDS:2, partial [Entrophospora sp. SA101]